MPKIRRRYNYGHVVMNPNIVGGTVLLCGQTVKVRTKNGEGRNVRFAGFVNSYRSDAPMPRVKLYEIEAFSHETGFGGDWICYGREVTMLGHYHPDDGVYLVLIDGLPMAWCELPKTI